MGSVTDPTYNGSGLPIEVTVSDTHVKGGRNSCGIEFRLQCAAPHVFFSGLNRIEMQQRKF